MEQHAIPRQITTFEFKLIGFLTLRQFGYVAMFFIIGLLFYYGLPVPLLNIFLALASTGVGLVMAFVRYNERPLDIWAKNMITKLFSSSQYIYKKNNQPPDFLSDVYAATEPVLVKFHVDAQSKLSSYVQKDKTEDQTKQKKQNIFRLFLHEDKKKHVAQQAEPKKTTLSKASKGPFLHGVVKDNKNSALSGVLVYIKDTKGKLFRILKTNHNGVFATFHALAPGSYTFEVKDLGQNHFFDTMNVDIKGGLENPLIFYSKRLL